jgi:hypothetical protein
MFPSELQGRFLNLCEECHWDFDGNPFNTNYLNTSVKEETSNIDSKK